MARLTLRRGARLTHDREFERVQEARVRWRSGPLSGAAVPNALPTWRLGLAIGRAFGPATARTAMKRRLREAFRHERAGLPLRNAGERRAAGYDLVLSVRPHAALSHAEYRRHLRELAASLHAAWGGSAGGRARGVEERA